MLLAIEIIYFELGLNGLIHWLIEWKISDHEHTLNKKCGIIKKGKTAFSQWKEQLMINDCIAIKHKYCTIYFSCMENGTIVYTFS